MNARLFDYNSILAGLALTALVTSCSTTKFMSRSNTVDKSLENKLNIEHRLDSIRNEINRRFSTDSINSRLVKTFSLYTVPKANILPENLAVIGNDTLDISYIPPGPADSALTAHNFLVMKNAARVFPKSVKPVNYINTMARACVDYRSIFSVPLEAVIALHSAESNFDPYVISSAGAVGISQFRPGTARDMGLRTFTQTDFPELYRLEHAIMFYASRYGYYDDMSIKNFKSHNFKTAEIQRIKADSLYNLYLKTTVDFAAEANRIGKDNIAKKDGTLVPEKAIPASVKYLAILARTFRKNYRCSDEQVLRWAIQAYNAGYGNVRLGVRTATETRDYIRYIEFKSVDLTRKY